MTSTRTISVSRDCLVEVSISPQGTTLALIAAEVRHFVLSSTAAVYGVANREPIPMAPRNHVSDLAEVDDLALDQLLAERQS